MTLEDLRQAIEHAVEAVRDFIERALPPEPALRPVPVPVQRPHVRRRLR